MQKKLIALAIAGLSGAAFAQSNVTIYGTMDATYDNVSATGCAAAACSNLESRGRTTMNSSFIGFKGSEDLGGGLKAVFQIETGVGENAAGSTNGVAGSTYGWANRDSMIALAGGFGTLAAGNLTGPARWIGAAMDVNSGATGIGANTALIGKFGGGSGAGYFDQRFANAIAYISPKLGGAFTGVIAYVPNENRSLSTAAGPNTSGWTVKALYEQGPIMAVYGYTKLKDSSTAGFGALATGLGGVTIADATDNRFAAKYNFGAGTVGVLFDQPKAKLIAGTDVKQTVYYIPVTYTVGAGKIIAQYGHANNASGSAVPAGLETGATHVVIGYEHNLSKRTTAKALYSAISNKANASYDFLYGVSAPNTTGTAASTFGAGADPKGFSVGIRHSF